VRNKIIITDVGLLVNVIFLYAAFRTRGMVSFVNLYLIPYLVSPHHVCGDQALTLAGSGWQSLDGGVDIPEPHLSHCAALPQGIMDVRAWGTCDRRPPLSGLGGTRLSTQRSTRPHCPSSVLAVSPTSHEKKPA
jgi:hypothetical protein